MTRRLFSRGSGSSPSLEPPSLPPFATEAVATGPARPIHLVYRDEKGKFQMDPEAVAVLQLVKNPPGVIFFCDRDR